MKLWKWSWLEEICCWSLWSSTRPNLENFILLVWRPTWSRQKLSRDHQESKCTAGLLRIHPDPSAAAVWTLAGKGPHPETTTLGKEVGGIGDAKTKGGTTETEEGKVRNGLRRNPGGMSIARIMREGKDLTRMTIGEVTDKYNHLKRKPISLNSIADSRYVYIVSPCPKYKYPIGNSIVR